MSSSQSMPAGIPHHSWQTENNATRNYLIDINGNPIGTAANPVKVETVGNIASTVEIEGVTYPIKWVENEGKAYPVVAIGSFPAYDKDANSIQVTQNDENKGYMRFIKRATAIDSGLMEDLYYQGVNLTAWEEGNSLGDSSVLELNLDHIRLYASNSEASDRSVVRSSVDLTLYSKVFVEWENIGMNHAANYSYLGTSESSSTFAPEGIRKEGAFERRVDSVDIGNLVGNTWVIITARDSSSSAERTAELKIYKVWLERS